ncbi:MAG: DUF2911 domain-containing protein [Lunatimonas sp.]|uniref:DUF2911 domain-containing protein n=1 Tax=Lunatimonas sp. TaxID=2060141 RepID=UPI00263ACAFB|nr:DUF2911 domain-containing protein [Lunatimonas sp.]MCC5936029.1 DUF2911 domain-containing protein [Lunatimonas sp.]
MRKHSLILLGLFLLFLGSAPHLAVAQLQAPAASPAAHVSQNVGFTKISMDYSSPAVKGRTIFGGLQKYGETWRAGANAPTTIEFSTAVNIGGKNIPAGKYTVFITPQATGDWTIHINGKGNAIYAYMENDKINEDALAKDDIVAVKTTPVRTSETQERLIYTISAEDNQMAKITMSWEKVQLSFKVDTQVNQKMEGFKGILAP